MKRKLVVRAAAALALFALGGFLVAASGIIPIPASAGHWPPTEWFLKFSMRRSVATHSLAIDAPPLDDRALVQKGATHFHTGCRSCHGSPDHPHPVIAQAMLPPATYLPERVPHWKAEQLFYIVKHGLKLTGMPAWPAQERDDEVWAVVAFLLELPELDAAEYRALALGGEGAGAETAPIADLGLSPASRIALRESCMRCHGAEGLGRKGAAPSLAGQPKAYLRNALEAYARGERKSGIMRPVAASLDAAALAELADHYAALPPAPPVRGDPGAVERGKAIAHGGIPSQSVPSCADCHGPGAAPRNAAYPNLAGQHEDYLLLQLELFEHDRRGGSAFASLMRPIAARLTPEQMRDAAAYYASLSGDGAEASK